MKILLITLNLFTVNIIFGQNIFDWHDTEFEIGSQRMLALKFDFDGTCTVKPCYSYKDNGKEYDQLIHFLAKNSTLKISIKYVFHKDNNVSNFSYYQRLAKGKVKGLKYELIKLNVLSRQVEFSEFQFSDTLKSTSGYEITIIETELPNHIKTIISDTTVNHFYNEQFDYFKLRPDTTDNKDLDKLGFYLEKILKNDTSLVIEISSYHDSQFLRYSIRRINLSEKTTQYLINNFDIKINQIQHKSCFFEHYYIENEDKNKMILAKIIKKSNSKECYKALIKKMDKCENCPF